MVRFGFITADGVEYFAAVDGHFLGCLNAETDLITADFDDDNGDVIVDHNTFVFLAGQY